MNNLLELDARDEKGELRVVVESPRGSDFKLRYDPELGAFLFQRVLPGLRYPYDWGFVPGTRAEDGDPLDAMVIQERATWPGVIIASLPIGALKISETKQPGGEKRRNDRLFVVPSSDGSLRSLDELAAGQLRELEHFFVETGKLANKEVSVEGWAGPSEAQKLIARAVRARAAG